MSVRIGVLFDFYDTLAHLEPASIEAGRRELARLAGVSYDAFAPLWRANREARMLGTAGDMARQLREMLRSIGVTPPESRIREMADLEHRFWEQAVRLYPDTLPILRALRERGHGLGIVSNCSIQAGAVIGFLGLRDLVDTVVLSYEAGVAKPDEAIYRRACDALQIEPAACLFVADGAGGELEAAHDVGMVAVKIRRPGQRQPEDLSVQADHRVESLAEVLALLTRLS